MALPRAVSESLLRFGVAADTLAWIDDLYGALGPGAVDAVGEVVARRGIAPDALRPDDLRAVRPLLGERYLRARHLAWMAGRPTPGFWRERSLGAGATGIVVPLGDLEAPSGALVTRVAQAARVAAGDDQPPPRGLLLLSRNTHVGNHPEAFALDIVPSRLEDALALNEAEGRHNTLPGSVGEASGRTNAEPAVALLWEVQPNVFKPSHGRNRAAGPAYRRHRSWPLAAAIGALAWLRDHGYRTFAVAGEALKATHEIDPARPLGPDIARLHDRTLERVAAALGLGLGPFVPDPSDDATARALASMAKVRLGEEIARKGLGAVVREVVGLEGLEPSTSRL